MPKEANADILNPEMIKLARWARRLNQQELAARMGVQQPHLSRVEGGMRTATPDFVTRLADALGFPESFFFQHEPIYGFGVGELYHRKKQDVTGKVIDRIHAEINIRRIHVARLLEAIEIPPCTIPHVDDDDQGQPVEDIARSVRARWMLPRGPVNDVCAIIESAGGIVVPFDFETPRMDAVSQWIPRMPPLFFVNSTAPKDRLRFSLAHELGHMICHANLGAMPDKTIEREANRFAAEFLMPTPDLSRDFDLAGRLSVERLAELKAKWKVSMAALLERALSLGKVTANQHRWLRIKLGEYGYLKQEPKDLEPRGEQPTMLNEMVALHLRELGYTADELGDFLRHNPDELRQAYLPAPRLRAV